MTSCVLPVGEKQTGVTSTVASVRGPVRMCPQGSPFPIRPLSFLTVSEKLQRMGLVGGVLSPCLLRSPWLEAPTLRLPPLWVLPATLQPLLQKTAVLEDCLPPRVTVLRAWQPFPPSGHPAELSGGHKQLPGLSLGQKSLQTRSGIGFSASTGI